MSSLVSLFAVVGFSQSDASASSETESDGGSKVIQVGVLLPKVELKDATGKISPSEALRNSYGALLNSDSIQLVALKSTLTSLALEEAKKHGIDYILKLSLIQERKKSGGSKLFGRVVGSTGRVVTGSVAQQVPYGGSVGTRVARSAARSAILSTGYALTDMTIKIKKKDKFTLQYGLTDKEGNEVLDKTVVVKMKKKNDDKQLLDMITNSAEDIAGAIIKP